MATLIRFNRQDAHDVPDPIYAANIYQSLEVRFFPDQKFGLFHRVHTIITSSSSIEDRLRQTMVVPASALECIRKHIRDEETQIHAVPLDFMCEE